MKKTNVMVEVSDDLYDAIVEPYKKRKGFGKLVVQLLEAYHTNESIYSYINGTIDGLESEATDELLKDLNSMAQSLNMFGVLQNQAEVVVDEGQRAFSEFGSQAQEDVGKFENLKTQDPIKESITREDVISIVNESVADIKEMLKNLTDGGKVSAPVAEQVQEAVETKINVSLGEAFQEKVVTSDEQEPIIPRQISKEEEEIAENILSSLLGSASF